MKLLALLTVAALAGCEASAAPAPTPSPAPPADPVLDGRGSPPVGSAAEWQRGGIDRQTNALAARSLAVSSLPQIQMLATEQGRHVLASVVACALPAGTTVTSVARDGAPYQFAGRLGLAPGWAAHAPTAAERQRVATCVRAQQSQLARR